MICDAQQSLADLDETRIALHNQVPRIVYEDPVAANQPPHEDKRGQRRSRIDFAAEMKSLWRNPNCSNSSQVLT